jgi:hypothetical protein
MSGRLKGSAKGGGGGAAREVRPDVFVDMSLSQPTLAAEEAAGGGGEGGGEGEGAAAAVLKAAAAGAATETRSCVLCGGGEARAAAALALAWDGRTLLDDLCRCRLLASMFQGCRSVRVLSLSLSRFFGCWRHGVSHLSHSIVLLLELGGPCSCPLLPLQMHVVSTFFARGFKYKRTRCGCFLPEDVYRLCGGLGAGTSMGKGFGCGGLCSSARARKE